MFCELHDSARDHPKTLKLARDLGIPPAHALGLMGSLWTWALRMAPDGDLSSFDDDDIEIGAGWTGEPGAFVKSASKRKYLDKTGSGYALHDWEDYAGTLKAAKRKREERDRKRHTTSQDNPSLSRDVTLNGTERNQRNGTNGTERNGPVTVPEKKTHPPGNGRPRAPEWEPKQLDGYAYIREWVEKDPIGAAAAITRDNDDRSRGGWGKLLKFGSKQLGGGSARTIFGQQLERLYGEMKQGEITNPGAQLNNYLKEAYGYAE